MSCGGTRILYTWNRTDPQQSANIALTGPKSKSKTSFLFRRNRSKSVGRNVNPSDGGRTSIIGSFPWGDSTAAYGTNKNFRVPTKCDISQPCMFQHIASVNEYNCDEFPSTMMMLNGIPNGTQRILVGFGIRSTINIRRQFCPLFIAGAIAFGRSFTDRFTE